MAKEDYRILTKTHILNFDTLVQATFKGQRKGSLTPWRQVNLRPVLLQGQRHLQISYLDETQDITKNYPVTDAAPQLDQLLALPFNSITVETTQVGFHIQFTKKGKAIIHRHKSARTSSRPDLSHDRSKDYLLPDNKPTPFLQAVGIMTPEGRVKTKMRGKFRQINAFLKLIQPHVTLSQLGPPPYNILDFGCGNAYLTFAVYYYFNHILKAPTHLIGIDVRADLLKKHAQTATRLDWPQIEFQPTRIIDYQPKVVPDLVLALHACDTATDEALYQAIAAQSKLIFAAPCCHNHLQQQLERRPAPVPFGPLFQHGILRARQGDLLTDTFRALIFRLMGYQTDVIEFTASEHTAKNLMIRAIKLAGDLPSEQLWGEYQTLKAFWGVTPYLETLLGERLAIQSR